MNRPSATTGNSSTSERPPLIPDLVSILVPVYNEEEFVGAILERVLEAPLPGNLRREVIVVDDGSTDASAEIVEQMARQSSEVRLLRHGRNRGKGAAIRTALAAARGEYSLVQDADLEYNPCEYGKLLRPLIEGRADAVYGSRFAVAGERRVLYFWHALANWILTNLANIAADLNLTDVETCYKAVRTQLLASIPLRSDGFGFEPEVTIKLAKREARIYEVPVSYHGRTYAEGKKIGFGDAVAALGVILRYWFSSDIYKEPGPGVLESFSAAANFNRWMAETIAPYVGERVLEVGAGIGNLSRLMSRRRKRYIATEIDAEHLARLRARFAHRPNWEFRRCNLEEAGDFDGFEGSVDTAICLNVLEHIEDDRAGLRNLYRVLTPGGRAIVLVPQGQWAFGEMDRALGHFRRYDADQLRARFVEAGFEVEKMLPFNRISLPAWYVNGKLLGRRAPNPLQLRMFDRTVWFWRRVDRWLPWGPASLICIGRKR